MSARKMNSRSLSNLMHEGRPTIHGERKKAHNISVTPTGWKGAQAIADQLGLSSVSDLVEQLGRQQIHAEHSSEDKLAVRLMEAKNELKDFLESTCRHLVKEVVAQVAKEQSCKPVVEEQERTE